MELVVVKLLPAFRDPEVKELKKKNNTHDKSEIRISRLNFHLALKIIVHRGLGQNASLWSLYLTQRE